MVLALDSARQLGFAPPELLVAGASQVGPPAGANGASQLGEASRAGYPAQLARNLGEQTERQTVDKKLSESHDRRTPQAGLDPQNATWPGE